MKNHTTTKTPLKTTTVIKFWYFFINNIDWHMEKVTDYVIINMICCNEALQKVAAHSRKTKYLAVIKSNTEIPIKLNAFQLNCELKAHFFSLINHCYFEGEKENSTNPTAVSILFLL